MAEDSQDNRAWAGLRLALLGLVLVAGLEAVSALDLEVSGGHAFSIGPSDLVGGAGSNFNPVHQSAAEAVLITVTGTSGGTDNWQLQVRKEDGLWHNSLALGVLRTGPGSGSGSISGGDSLPLTLNSSDQVFIEGAGDRSGIPVRLILSGVSVLVPADSYLTTIYITILDLP